MEDQLLLFTIIFGELLAVLVYVVVARKLTQDRFKRFLGIVAIGLAASFIPFGFVSMILGAPSVLVAAGLVTLFLDKPKTENK